MIFTQNYVKKKIVSLYLLMFWHDYLKNVYTTFSNRKFAYIALTHFLFNFPANLQWAKSLKLFL